MKNTNFNVLIFLFFRLHRRASGYVDNCAQAAAEAQTAARCLWAGCGQFADARG